MYELSNFLELSLTIFCFLPAIISLIAFGISFYTFYYNFKTREICKNIDDNINQLLREKRDEYYKNKFENKDHN